MMVAGVAEEVFTEKFEGRMTGDMTRERVLKTKINISQLFFASFFVTNPTRTKQQQALTAATSALVLGGCSGRR